MSEKTGTPLNPGDDPQSIQEADPGSGASDDPRVDPTPDTRHGETEHVEQPTAPGS